MKLLKNISVFGGLILGVAFADFVGIANNTDKPLVITKVESGAWTIQLYELEKDVIRTLDKDLKDNEELNVKIPSKEGCLLRYLYSYKPGSEKALVFLKGESDIVIDLANDEEESSQQGSYKICQEYNGGFNRQGNKNIQKLQHACDKMIVVSGEK